MRRAVFAALAALALPVAAAAQQLAPAGTGGVASLERALARLDQNKRVLMIAAHPDDEDTELLTLLSRGLGVDAAYLSLSRGEGGQNLIGPELGEALGLIRTGELLAARSVDGSRQYFTRAFDFGFSKTLEETLRFWPRDTLLADVLRVIRRFRPQVIITTFSGTPRDGHGQHQASAVIAREAFELLRDSAWGPRKLYRNSRFDTTGTTTMLPSGIVDPVEGRSYLQMAMAARSLHRSQDMGQLQRVGPSSVRVALVATADGQPVSRSAGQGDALFAGVDTSLAPELRRYRALIDSARALMNPRALARVAPVLAAALRELRRTAPAEFRAAKEPILSEAIATAASVVVDAVADDGRVVPGQTLRVAATVWNAGGLDLQVTAVALATLPGWHVAAQGASLAPDGGAPGFFGAGRVPVHGFTVTVPADAAPSTPYFLARPRTGALYDWSSAPEAVRGAPLDPPLLTARFALTVAGADITLEREVGFRYNDQALGEIRKPLLVVPAIGVSLDPEVLVWPTGGSAARTVNVELTSGRQGSVSGLLRLVLPDGWPAVAPQPFTLAGEETRTAFSFAVRAPADLRPGQYVLRAVAQADGVMGAEHSMVADYPHIRPVPYVRVASARVEAAAIALPGLRGVGYVRGASDAVPEALASVGVPVRVLTAAELERGDLTAFDVIVIGSRAYETDPALVANNGRLLDWVRGGGRLLVQYQQYPFVRGGFAPFPLRIAQPHDRVTDEGAPVTPLAADDPAFRTPNVIGSADWEGWIQERGLYFAREFDPAYRPLLETGDAGERLRGGLLVARYGNGLYVYTGLAFFRELPAGVPGAYRLFANLLGLRPTDVP